MLKVFVLAMAALFAAGCGESIAPKVSTSLKAKRGDDGTIALALTIKNQRDVATVPLLIELDAAGKPVIHPVPFVLNSHEARTINGTLNDKNAVTARWTVKEAERGRLVTSSSQQIPAAN